MSGVGADGCSTVVLPGAVRATSSCSSRTSRDRLVSSGLVSVVRVWSSARRRAGVAAATVSHRAGDEWCSQRCTSRCSARAASTCRRAGDSRLAPNTEIRSGRSLSCGRSRSCWQASSSSSAGLGVPSAPRSRRHSSACHREVVVERAAVTALVATGCPGAQHLRPGLPVLVEHPRQSTRDREPSPLVLRVGAEVLGQRPAPRLGRGRGVDDLEQWPHRPLRRPPLDRRRVLGRGGLQRLVDQGARPREADVGADAVTCRRTQHVRQPLRDPALHALGRHRDHLGRERVGGRDGEDLGQPPRQRCPARGPMGDEHGR